MAGMPELRRYQLEIARAVFGSVLLRRGLTFTVEIARQGGKNEVSAQLGVWLLSWERVVNGDGKLVKAAPTFNPQALVSLRRLRDRLSDSGLGKRWWMEGGNIVRVGRAQQTFLSAEPTANVVGATADTLLELDEAQDVDRDKFIKEFRPMGATGNATTVLYGTPWDGGTLLEAMAEENRELERKDGVRRDFRFDWEAVAACSPLYRAYVESERDRLGEEHPLFRTQYRLLPIAAGEGMFNRGQLALLRGEHSRLRGPLAGAGVRRGGGRGGGAVGDELRIEYGAGPSTGSGRTGVGRRVRGRPFDRLRANGGGRVRARAGGRAGRDGGDDWRARGRGAAGRAVGAGCGALPVDGGATPLADARAGGPGASARGGAGGWWWMRRGLATGVASALVKALGGAVEPFVFTAGSKSRLGFELLGAVNTGRVSAYAGDGSSEYGEFWREMELAQARYRVNQTMDFFVEASRGHDDYLMSLALMVRAAASPPRTARGRVGETPPS